MKWAARLCYVSLRTSFIRTTLALDIKKLSSAKNILRGTIMYSSKIAAHTHTSVYMRQGGGNLSWNVRHTGFSPTLFTCAERRPSTHTHTHIHPHRHIYGAHYFTIVLICIKLKCVALLLLLLLMMMLRCDSHTL